MAGDTALRHAMRSHGSASCYAGDKVQVLLLLLVVNERAI